MRRLSRLPLPAYAYLPGRSPHPTRDPLGHHVLVDAALPDEDVWRYALDLYNFGYFFEAHVAFEALLRRTASSSSERTAHKALVNLAGALLKRRLGHASAARRLAERAASLLERAAVTLPELHGVELSGLARAVRDELCSPTSMTASARPPLSIPLGG